MRNSCATVMACLALAGLLVGLSPAAQADDVVRTYASPTAYIAQAIVVPAGYETVWLSGIMADIPKPPADAGDAEAQAFNVFSKIGTILKAHGASESDVVAMTIFMYAPDDARMDFEGMMRAYTKFYGSPTQPNRPRRSTVQVKNLGIPGALLEVEVTAMRKPK